MAHFYPVLLFLYTCLSQVDSPGLPVKVEVVEAEVGGDAILPCNYNAQLDNKLQVKWEREGMVVHFYRSGGDDNSTQNKNFTNRTFLKYELDNGNTSLNLTKVTEWDYGNYTCTIVNKGLSRKCNITLGLPVKAEVGGDAILPCNLHTPLDNESLQVKWERKGLVVHFYRSGGDYNSTQHKNFTSRTFLKYDLDKGNTSLNLTKVTEQDAGLYTCTVHNKNLRKARRCYVKLKPVNNSDTDLTDKSAGPEKTGNGKISNIVITVIVVGLAVVIAIVGSVVRKKRRNNAGGDGGGGHVQVPMDDLEDVGQDPGAG